MKREEDPGIAWIRDVRHKISAQFDHDPKKLGGHLRELEKKYADLIIMIYITRHNIRRGAGF